MTAHGMADENNEEHNKIAQRVLNVNINGTNNCSAEIIKYFRANGGGNIVNIGSQSSRLAYAGDWAYVTSKAGIEGLTRSYAISYAAENIRCNCVLPYVVLTEGAIQSLLDAGVSEEDSHADAPNPMNKPIEASDIAYAIMFLASDQARRINGQFIEVDCGISCMMPASVY